MPAHRRPAVVLLVEDDKADQELTRRNFAKIKTRNELHIAEDGEQALDYLHRRGPYTNPDSSPRPDLILLDLNMPRIGGKEVLRAMRADPQLRRIPVVVFTTSNQEQDILDSYDLGASSFVTKPSDAKRFDQSVRSLENYWLDVVVLPPR